MNPPFRIDPATFLDMCKRTIVEQPSEFHVIEAADPVFPGQKVIYLPAGRTWAEFLAWSEDSEENRERRRKEWERDHPPTP